MVDARQISGVAMLLLAGCAGSSTLPTEDVVTQVEESPREVTLRLAGMNQQLKIL